MKRRPRNGSTLGTHTIAQLAQCGDNTVRRWMEKGLLPFERLPSGFRRAKREDVLAFFQKYDLPIPERLAHVPR